MFLSVFFFSLINCSAVVLYACFFVSDLMLEMERKCVFVSVAIVLFSMISSSVGAIGLAPSAGFSVEPVSPFAGDEVSFVDESFDSDGSIVTGFWNFGDGTGQSWDGSAVSHTYIDDGTYEVSLLVVDDDDNEDVFSMNVSVRNNRPVADFSMYPLTPNDVDETSFTDASYDVDGSLVNWSWSFGDGQISFARNPRIVFLDDGTFNVSLTVVDDDGNSSTMTVEVVVDNVAPVAGFDFSPTAPSDVEVVSFTSSSSDVDGMLVNWTWNVEEQYFYSENISHTFSDDGIFNVSLTVVDDDGTSSAVSKQISVSNVGPTAKFSFRSNECISIIPGCNVTFSSNSFDVDGSLTNLSWSIFDETYYGGSFQYVFDNIGSFEVSLSVVDDDGKSSEVSQFVSVVSTNYSGSGGGFDEMVDTLMFVGLGVVVVLIVVMMIWLERRDR